MSSYLSEYGKEGNPSNFATYFDVSIFSDFASLDIKCIKTLVNVKATLAK